VLFFFFQTRHRFLHKIIRSIYYNICMIKIKNFFGKIFFFYETEKIKFEAVGVFSMSATLLKLMMKYGVTIMLCVAGT